MRREVRVPATTANLGPGFDCLGVALGTYLNIGFSSAAKFEIAGRGRLHPIPGNLTYRSFLAAYALAGRQVPTVRIETIGRYPSARGLGASASAIVAGLVGARAFGNLDLGDEDLAKLAVEIEGHPDNVLPALFGGLVLSVGESWIRLEPNPAIAPLILVAADGFKTKSARRVLPAQISRADAIANAASTAALVAIMCGIAGPELLMAATTDRLHEPYRLPLMPASQKVHEQLRSEGIPTTLSGAGPSLLCLVETEEQQQVADKVRGALPQGWNVLTPGWDLGGARVI
jgi:homoserine kinase